MEAFFISLLIVLLLAGVWAAVAVVRRFEAATAQADAMSEDE